MHPKYKRYIKQIIPFGLIWFLFGFVYSLIEYGILGNLDHYPTTNNPYDFRANLISIPLSTFVMGIIQGFIEIVWLRKRLEHKKLWVKIVLKCMFYLFLIIVFLALITITNSLVNFNDGIFGSEVMASLKRFISVFSFWSIAIYMGVILGFAIFFSEIGEYLGEGVLYNFLFGKYHRPKQEIRIFMFLDMKSSTTIAEEIGHKKYFNLIRDYYADMTDAILETMGEIYQYVGDEIVVSWPEKMGVYNNNCIQCFNKIYGIFEERSSYYVKTYGMAPAFKAGYHIGEVTTGEIGIIKRDIIYTGDVLNTTARIQGECNKYKAKLLISRDLMNKLPSNNEFKFNEIGKLLLRGKTETIQLYRIEF